MQEEKNYLEDIETTSLYPASAGLRFLNFIIDVIVYYILAIIVSFFLMPFSAWLNEFRINHRGGAEFLFLGMGMAIYLFYYFLMEGITKGRTIGKLLTGTKAVNLDGQPITWKQAAIRTIIRFIPFEPFSTFGGFPWHDSWAYTIVVKQHKS